MCTVLKCRYKWTWYYKISNNNRKYDRWKYRKFRSLRRTFRLYEIDKIMAKCYNS